MKLDVLLQYVSKVPIIVLLHMLPTIFTLGYLEAIVMYGLLNGMNNLGVPYHVIQLQVNASCYILHIPYQLQYNL